MGRETCLPNPHLLAAPRATGGAWVRPVWSMRHSARPVQNRMVQTLSEWQLMFIRLSLYARHGMETGVQRERGLATCAERKDDRGVTDTRWVLTHTHTHISAHLLNQDTWC